ncbi:MAG TPA: VOC family protein [Solirubrobacteraceae bacterium]|jgi:catechol 2,3-dioxygenase
MSGPTLAAVELRCPKFDESRAFFTDVLGLVESDADEQTSYLRCVGESAHASVVLRRDARAGLAALVLASSSAHNGNDAGTWPQRTCDGHTIRVVPQRKRSEPYGGERLILNQPTPLRGIGVEPRRLAHVGLVVSEPQAAADWWSEHLGYELRESVEDEHGALLSTVAVTSASCDVMLVRHASAPSGAFHHVAFAVDQRDRIADAALYFAELAVPIEVGLGQHGVGQLSYLYAFEPSGNRIALVQSPLVWEPDSAPVHWSAETWPRALWLWGAPPPASFFEVNT